MSDDLDLVLVLNVGDTYNGLVVHLRYWDDHVIAMRDGQPFDYHPDRPLPTSPPKRVLLTSDGNWVNQNRWCRCNPKPARDAVVEFHERQSNGLITGGLACPQCRQMFRVKRDKGN